MIDIKKQRLTIEEAMNPTPEDAIKYLKSMVFPQDMSPSTLRAAAVNKMAIAALQEKIAEPHKLTLDELRQMDGQPVFVDVLLDGFPGEWALASEFCKGATTASSVFQYDNYGVHWIAYDRPPGGEPR